MKKSIMIATIAIALFSCKKDSIKENSVAEVKAVWSSNDKFASWNNGGYTVYNNVWGGNAGPQSIWANSFSNWGVWCSHSGGGIKSYPNSTRYVGRSLSSLGSCRSSFNSSTPNGGAWSSAYDIWDNSNQHETMLWMNYTSNSDGSGNIKPISYNWNAQGNPVPVYWNVNVGGHTWNVFRGHNGGNNVYSFLRTSKTNSGTVDILAIQRWIQARGWYGNITLGAVQYGYEITNTNGGANFNCNSYSVSFN
ncbi:MAG: hypothetical protein ABIN67_03725 [Ferruginibacter sp.]